MPRPPTAPHLLQGPACMVFGNFALKYPQVSGGAAAQDDYQHTGRTIERPGEGTLDQFYPPGFLEARKGGVAAGLLPELILSSTRLCAKFS